MAHSIINFEGRKRMLKICHLNSTSDLPNITQYAVENIYGI